MISLTEYEERLKKLEEVVRLLVDVVLAHSDVHAAIISALKTKLEEQVINE